MLLVVHIIWPLVNCWPKVNWQVAKVTNHKIGCFDTSRFNTNSSSIGHFKYSLQVNERNILNEYSKHMDLFTRRLNQLVCDLYQMTYQNDW